MKQPIPADILEAQFLTLGGEATTLGVFLGDAPALLVFLRHFG
jgi:hypothetical protein